MRARNKNSASTASTSIGTTSRASPTSTTSPSLNSRRHLITMSSSMTTSCRLACRRRTSFRREIPATSPGGATQVSQLLIITFKSRGNRWNLFTWFRRPIRYVCSLYFVCLLSGWVCLDFLSVLGFLFQHTWVAVQINPPNKKKLYWVPVSWVLSSSLKLEWPRHNVYVQVLQDRRSRASLNISSYTQIQSSQKTDLLCELQFYYYIFIHFCCWNFSIMHCSSGLQTTNWRLF